MCDCYTCACSASTWNNLCLASKVLQRRNETHHLPICRKLGSCRSNGRILVRIWKMQNLKNLGSVLGPFWVHFGVSGRPSGSTLGSLEASWVYLGVPWSSLRRSWEHPVPLGGHLCTLWVKMAATGEPFWRSFSDNWQHVEADWARLCEASFWHHFCDGSRGDKNGQSVANSGRN